MLGSPPVVTLFCDRFPEDARGVIDVLTLAAASRQADVRVLARSVAELVPASRFHWFVADADRAAAASFDLEGCHPSSRTWPLPGPAAGADEGRLRDVAVPSAALRLAERGESELVAYLSPQTVVFSPLDELWTAGRAAEIVLAPVLVHADLPSADRPPEAELRALRHGVYGLPFFAIRPGTVGTRFLSWWEDRARSFVPPPDERRLLRPWLNLAPALFPEVRVLRSPRLGVGRDNLDVRSVEGTPESGLLVDGMPLGTFDFAGIDDGSLDRAIGRAPGDGRAWTALSDWYRRRRREELEPTVAASPSGALGSSPR